MSSIKDVFSSNMKKPKANVSKEKPDKKKKKHLCRQKTAAFKKQLYHCSTGGLFSRMQFFLLFTCMPCDSYPRPVQPLLWLCLPEVFQAIMNPSVCWPKQKLGEAGWGLGGGGGGGGTETTTVHFSYLDSSCEPGDPQVVRGKRRHRHCEPVAPWPAGGPPSPRGAALRTLPGTSPGSQTPGCCCCRHCQWAERRWRQSRCWWWRRGRGSDHSVSPSPGGSAPPAAQTLATSQWTIPPKSWCSPGSSCPHDTRRTDPRRCPRCSVPGTACGAEVGWCCKDGKRRGSAPEHIKRRGSAPEHINPLSADPNTSTTVPHCNLISFPIPPLSPLNDGVSKTEFMPRTLSELHPPTSPTQVPSSSACPCPVLCHRLKNKGPASWRCVVRVTKFPSYLPTLCRVTV